MGRSYDWKDHPPRLLPDEMGQAASLPLPGLRQDPRSQPALAVGSPIPSATLAGSVLIIRTLPIQGIRSVLHFEMAALMIRSKPRFPLTPTRRRIDARNEFRPTVIHSAGIWKRNVAPFLGADSTRMRPPCRSTIVLQRARPIPVPGYSSALCKRSKTRKICSA